jgi:hypothetical protein
LPQRPKSLRNTLQMHLTAEVIILFHPGARELMITANYLVR